MGKTVIDGRYVVGALIGADRFGEVYEATQEKLNRKVSIKLLSSRNATPEVVARFTEYAGVLSKLHHPSILFVGDFGMHEGRPYLVRDVVEGNTLEQRIEEEDRLSASDVVPILLQIAEALDYAHQAGVQHLNLQPANIVISSEGRARVLDFGLTRLVEEDDGLTPTSTIVGTSWYRSPEQARGKAVDETSDLYSLGVIGFRLLTGRFPFEAPNLEQMLSEQARKAAPPIAEKQKDVPKSVAAIIDRLLLQEPADRFPAASWVVNALRATAAEMGLPEAGLPGPSITSEIISAPDIEGWVVSTSAPGMHSSSGQLSSPAIEDWVVPSSEPALSTADILQQTKLEDHDDPSQLTFWKRHGENVKIGLGALYLIAIAGATFYYTVGLPDAANEVRGMIRRRQAPQVIPQLQHFMEAKEPDPELRAALGLAYVHVREPRKALVEYARVAEASPDYLADWDVAAIVPLLALPDKNSLEAEKILLALGDRAKSKIRAAFDASSDPYFKCRAGDVLTKLDDRTEFLPSCRAVLDLQSCGARKIAIDRLAEDPDAQPRLQALANVVTSTAGEDCGYQNARAALARR